VKRDGSHEWMSTKKRDRTKRNSSGRNRGDLHLHCMIVVGRGQGGDKGIVGVVVACVFHLQSGAERSGARL
jgi:hypothetical protein